MPRQALLGAFVLALFVAAPFGVVAAQGIYDEGTPESGRNDTGPFGDDDDLAGDDGDGNDTGDDGNAAGDGGRRVTLCHRTGGDDGTDRHTITVAEDALDAHQDHGDALGACDDSVDAQALAASQDHVDATLDFGCGATTPSTTGTAVEVSDVELDATGAFDVSLTIASPGDDDEDDGFGDNTTGGDDGNETGGLPGAQIVGDDDDDNMTDDDETDDNATDDGNETDDGGVPDGSGTTTSTVIVVVLSCEQTENNLFTVEIDGDELDECDGVDDCVVVDDDEDAEFRIVEEDGVVMVLIAIVDADEPREVRIVEVQEDDVGDVDDARGTPALPVLGSLLAVAGAALVLARRRS